MARASGAVAWLVRPSPVGPVRVVSAIKGEPSPGHYGILPILDGDDRRDTRRHGGRATGEGRQTSGHSGAITAYALTYIGKILLIAAQTLLTMRVVAVD